MAGCLASHNWKSRLPPHRTLVSHCFLQTNRTNFQQIKNIVKNLTSNILSTNRIDFQLPQSEEVSFPSYVLINIKFPLKFPLIFRPDMKNGLNVHSN